MVTSSMLVVTQGWHNCHDLSLPGIIDLQGQWKLLTPRQARKLRVVSKAHAKLTDKQVGVS